jgi:hypothetical protein
MFGGCLHKPSHILICNQGGRNLKDVVIATRSRATSWLLLVILLTLVNPYHNMRTWALAKCRYFVWLVAHSMCWTADRLARQGMDHPEKCPLCNQEEETILIIYSFLVCSQGSFGSACFSIFSSNSLLHNWTPLPLWTGGRGLMS